MPEPQAQPPEPQYATHFQDAMRGIEAYDQTIEDLNRLTKALLTPVGSYGNRKQTELNVQSNNHQQLKMKALEAERAKTRDEVEKILDDDGRWLSADPLPSPGRLDMSKDIPADEEGRRTRFRDMVHQYKDVTAVTQARSRNTFTATKYFPLRSYLWATVGKDDKVRNPVDKTEEKFRDEAAYINARILEAKDPREALLAQLRKAEESMLNSMSWEVQGHGDRVRAILEGLKGMTTTNIHLPHGKTIRLLDELDLKPYLPIGIADKLEPRKATVTEKFEYLAPYLFAGTDGLVRLKTLVSAVRSSLYERERYASQLMRDEDRIRLMGGLKGQRPSQATRVLGDLGLYGLRGGRRRYGR